MSDWYLIRELYEKSAADNMAIDEYLFNLCQRKNIGFFRIYFWDKPSFSIGVSQKVSKAVNVDFIQKNEYALVRRITGGKTVLHHDEVTYSVASSENFFFKDHDLYKSYMLISRVLVNALRTLGVNASQFNGNTSHLSKSNFPCFSFSTPNEIETGGKKIIASAQKRNEKALLQHGSIPITMDYELYASGANSRAEIIRRSMTTLKAVTEKSKEDLINSLINNFQDFIGCELKEFKFNVDQKKEIKEIKEKYLSEKWNFLL